MLKPTRFVPGATVEVWGPHEEMSTRVSQEPLYRMKLMGAFRLSAPDGRRLDIRSRKTIALLALLATSETGERARTWLQEKLWGTRDLHQAQNSLRREVFNLRRLTEPLGLELVRATARTVRLCLDNVLIDTRTGSPPASPSEEFLEGLEIAGERSFEEWLREMRDRMMQAPASAEDSDAQPGIAPSPSPAAGPQGVTLLIFPFTLAGIENGAAEQARGAAFRLFIEHLGRTRYFTVAVWPTPADERMEMSAVKAATQASARFGLIGQVVSQRREKRFSLSIFRSSDGRVLWSEPTALPEETESDAFWLAVQRTVNRTIQIISHDEIQQASSQDPKLLDANGLTWMIRFLLYNANQAVFEKARTYIDIYLARHPHDPEAIIQNSVYEIVHQFKFSEAEPDEARLRQLAQRAIQANWTDVRGPSCAAFVEMMAGRLDLAIGHAETAVDMVPGYIEANTQLGHLYLLDGRLDMAGETLQRALDLSPNPWRDSYTLSYLALYHALTEDFEKAIEYSNQSLVVTPDEALPILIKVHALVELGRAEEAEQILLVHGPVVWDRMERVLRGLAFRDEAVRERFRTSFARVMRRTGALTGAAGKRGTSVTSS